MIHFLWIGLVLVSSFLCMQLAKIKGRSPHTWSVLGALFGPVALVVLLMLESNKEEEE